MKRAIPIVLAIGAALIGYHYYDRSHAPESHYKKFAEAILYRNYDAAAALAEGLTSRDLEKAGSQEKVGAGPQMFQTLFPSGYDIESREVSPDGVVTLHAVQTILFNPPGVESALRPAMYAKMNQVITLRKSSGGWKITSFENKFGSMDSLSSR